jgi:EmrB/QacA subfamily drug resistance transporter
MASQTATGVPLANESRRRHWITEQNAKWWTLGAMCSALFMLMLDNTVVNVALPSIQRDLGTSIGELEWTVNGYTLSLAVLLVTGGRLGDIFGRRLMFNTGVVIFALSSATAGLAASPGMLVASRVVQGVGAALMMPATLSIVTHAFPAEERGKALGTWAGVSALALSIGPLVGGLLVEHVSWRAIFFINLPVAALAVAAALFVVRESRDRMIGRVIDYPGVATLTVALTAIILALIEGNSWGWGSAGVMALLAGGALMLVAFVCIELRVRAPMLEFEFFRARNFLGANAVAFIVTFAMFGTFFFMAIYMQDVLGYSPLEAGVRFLPTTVLVVIVAPLAGRLTDRVGALWPIASGLAVLTVALYLFSRINAQTTFSDLLLPFIPLGIGVGMVMSPMSTAAMNAVSTEKAGIASGIVTMSRMVGGSVGVAATGAIFQAQLGAFDPAALATGGAAARTEFTDALGTAMAVAAIVSLAGLSIALATVRGRGRRGAAVAVEDGTVEQPAGQVVTRGSQQRSATSRRSAGLAPRGSA